MNIHKFDLNLLRVLDALLHEGSTVLAGQRLGLSQPAVSAALRRLREGLNDPLFVRHGQHLQPTDYARALEIPIKEILDQLEKILAGPARFAPALAQECFKLSGSDFFAEILMPPLAAFLSDTAPGIRIQLVDLVPDNYVGTLEKYEVDLALIPQTQFPEWINSQPVFHSSFVVIARNRHAALEAAQIKPGSTIPMALFCDLGHILFSPEGKLKAMGDAALARVRQERTVVMTLPVFSGVCRAVSNSDHIALVPRQYAEAVAPSLGLEIYRAPMPMDPALISMIWHKRANNNPAHQWLRKQIATVLLPLNHGENPLPESPQ
ncbi:LysR family transcriptional regulator [Sneathiella sp.]|jgi:DNA-binding transcriptional LysR family regulator|uniref:LysR family transcriptional regulator n=1 Tax=Sneathiella sp. TaxID=1964365 RepID=UPI0039E6A31A